MSIKLYNTLTRQKEDFKPIHKGKAGIYACGPTVYWFAHIGNLRSFVFADVLRRTLTHSGLDVKFVMNITDVGHLTDDASDGEDKMIVAMKREGKTAYEIAEFYTQAFMKDIDRLNILSADEYPRATDHIQEQIDMVSSLEKNGYTYQTSDGVYFDTSKLKDYGRLSGQLAEEKKAGARIDMGEKKNSTDFALWKFSPDGVQRDMEWESPWGVGFPGWHIECSAMSVKYLDAPFDIHTGGIDHIAVHHENELAQTQGALDALQANVWMHGEFLTVDGGRMGKSLGNLFTVDDLIEKGFDPIDFRYLVLGAHYRTQLNFTFEALTAAQNALNRLRETVRAWEAPGGDIKEFEDRFNAALADDLNTPQALAVMWEMVDSDHSTSAKAKSLLRFDEVLGLGMDLYVAVPLEVPENVRVLVSEREQARIDKDWGLSDALRIKIAEVGYLVEDTDSGSVVKQK
ncbi:MAG: cysteine--tRNA ligase [Parcubacteria group bacterium]|nr:cysteine--tRNA ligase [Parcubacteria group bacterium]